MAKKISAVYQIVNTVTGDRYVGSSKDVKRRWAEHKRPYNWGINPNKLLYQDMQKYGVGNFRLQILSPVMEEHLKQVEQEFIELLQPAYNRYRAKGRNIERRKEYLKEYNQSGKEKEASRRYLQSDKGKETRRKYRHQLCLYNGEELTLNALWKKLSKAGVEHPFAEAREYLIKGEE